LKKGFMAEENETIEGKDTEFERPAGQPIAFEDAETPGITESDPKDQENLEMIRTELREDSETITHHEMMLSKSLGEKTVSYYEKGKKEEPLVFMIHGWMQTGETFNKLMRELKGYHIYSIDLPGFGDSEALDKEQLNYYMMAAALDEIINQLADGREIYGIVGHSMGSALAAELLKHKAIHPKKMVLNGLPVSGIKSSKPLAKSITLEKIMTSFLTLQKVFPNWAKKLVARTQHKGLVETSAIDEDYIAGQSKVDPETGMRMAENMTRIHYDEIDIPKDTEVLMTMGENDKFCTPEEAGEAAKASGCDFIVYQDKGHEHYIDTPQVFNKAVEDFFEKE
jgi:pimeloyl-ACP methyl ester carboxylesterase